MFLLAVPGVAQSPPDVDQGMKLYGSWHGGAIDTVNIVNGNVFVHADLFSYSQRGAELAYPVMFEYNNKNLSLYQTPCPPGTKLGHGCNLQQTVIFGPNPLRSQNRSLGNSVTVGYEGLAQVGQSGLIDTSLAFNGGEIYVNTNSVVTPDGSTHQLAKTATGMVALDGSGFAINSSNGLFDRHGTLLAGTLAEDRNGNQISLSSSGVWTDTLGRAIPQAPILPPATVTPPASTASTGSCPLLNYAFQTVSYAYTWNLPTVNGANLPLILCYTSVWVRTGTATGPNYFDVNKAFYMLQSVVLPDNTYWAFQYDAADPNNSATRGYGDLLKLTFPTGGSVTYTLGASGLASCGMGIDRAVQTRTVDANDGTGPHTWHYNGGVVTDPLGNDTVHSITALTDGTIVSCSFYETQTQYFQGSHASGTLLKTVNTDYQWTENPYDGAVIGSDGVQSNASSLINVFPIRVTTTLPNGLVSKVETDYDTALAYHGALDGITWNVKECPPTDPGGNNNSDCHYYFYGAQNTEPVTSYTGSYGKPIAVREYDYGQGAPGALLRQTKTTYQWQVNSAYLTANMLDLPATVQVLDGAGHLCSETDYTYDEAAPTAPSPAITTQHTSAPGAVRGNLTTTTHKLSATPCQASASWTNVISHSAWFDTGELQSSADPLGHTTSHLYDSVFVGAYPTQTTNALGQNVFGGYDLNTGLLTSFTDQNGLTSNFSYDQYWRFLQALGPVDSANGSQRSTTTFSYTAHQGTTPAAVNRTKSVTTALTDSASSKFDGLGRPYQSDHATPSGQAEVLTTYDALGRAAAVTNPYYAGSN
ncbi:MAG TPA: hypothetical protein VFP71_06840, partial [Candidatus Angelobacter sp.]|nr:hypothetical protein [Candidatus Angelobacter sp.]